MKWNERNQRRETKERGKGMEELEENGRRMVRGKGKKVKEEKLQIGLKPGCCIQEQILVDVPVMDVNLLHASSIAWDVTMHSLVAHAKWLYPAFDVAVAAQWIPTRGLARASTDAKMNDEYSLSKISRYQGHVFLIVAGPLLKHPEASRDISVERTSSPACVPVDKEKKHHHAISLHDEAIAQVSVPHLMRTIDGYIIASLKRVVSLKETANPGVLWLAHSQVHLGVWVGLVYLRLKSSKLHGGRLMLISTHSD
jgi:hypothetical protein